MARSLHSSVSAARVAARVPSLARLAFALAIALGSSSAFAQSICDTTGAAAPPTATGTGGSFACGDAANASGATSTALGSDAISAGGNSTAVGAESRSSGDFSSALGRSANSSGAASTAVGYNAAASAANAMAFGSNSVASGANASALGTGATASGADSTALGNAASATAANSVALGAGSVADEDNTVSVGAAGAERKVTNVAAGTNDTDAVNVSQLNDTAATTLASANTYTDQAAGDTLTAANTYTDQQISLLGAGGGVASADLEQLRTDMNDRFAGVEGRLDGVDARLDGIDEHLRKMDRRIGRQGAMTAALVQSSGMPEVGENYLGAGVGWSEGENAFAASFRRRFSEHFSASVGGATSGNESSVGVGAGFTW